MTGEINFKELSLSVLCSLNAACSLSKQSGDILHVLLGLGCDVPLFFTFALLYLLRLQISYCLSTCERVVSVMEFKSKLDSKHMRFKK